MSPPAARDRYDSLFRYYAGLRGLDWLRLKAQAMAESGLDPTAESPVGAKGLTQFMDPTWAEWWDGVPGIGVAPAPADARPDNPEWAIKLQSYYMGWLLKQFGTWRLAWAAYNWGPGRVRKVGDQPRQWPQETRDYVARIERFYVELSVKG